MTRFDGTLAALSRQCADLFGEEHSYIPVGQLNAVTLKSVDVNPMIFRHDVSGPQFESRWVRLAAFPTGIVPQRGDAFSLNGQEYVVTDVQLDGGDGVYLTTNRIRVQA